MSAHIGLSGRKRRGGWAFQELGAVGEVNARGHAVVLLLEAEDAGVMTTAGLEDGDGEARWNGSRWRRPGTGRGRGSDGDKLEASAMGAPRRAVAVAVSKRRKRQREDSEREKMKGSREKASRRRTGGGGTTTWRRTGLERCLPGTRCRGGQPADGSEGKSPDPTRERTGTGLNGSGKCRTCPRWWWSKDEAALVAHTGFHGAGRGAAKEREADEVPYGRLRGSIGGERVMARTAGRRQGTLGEGARLRRRGFQGSRGAGLGDGELRVGGRGPWRFTAAAVDGDPLLTERERGRVMREGNRRSLGR